ncbi:formate dehydrogenase accessory sulfurtransferase FdhD [Infirmifilum lucidum]|uniref:Formate dehydrogenase accessory sulfurtransferase FdhD n=1 Tax=Infirmifilum lucidum TaxID=2776706 RepID=A0A7L9FIR7_9CREN|nr:formate dehydrogenase accessory sulfurtransferase FdhD [Infirmifilum lucidum]QOJ78923.1 formate dehydrogenase accessory sulfurtransferase FdhD [Infirmifilum lucidum]
MVRFSELAPEYVTLEGQAVAVDELYTVYVNGKSYVSISASPSGLYELALGLLVGDGVASGPGDILDVKVDRSSRRIDVYLDRDVSVSPYRVEDCGAAAARGVYVYSGATFSLRELVGLVGEFDRASIATARLLAVHSSAIVQPSRGEGVLAHDPSRHTSMVKAIGSAIARGFKLGDSVAITTGRASSDIVVRLARAGVPVLVSLKGPLMSGIRASEMLGVTLVLVARHREGGRGFRPVTHPWRILPT